MLCSPTFGPDGYLYVPYGDGGGQNDPFNRGQDLNSLLGAVIRIDVSQSSLQEPFRIPQDNPFVGMENVREEIWAYGLRNPWRTTWDKSGNFFVGDVGQIHWEEISLLTKGANLGWRLFEGPVCLTSQDAPETCVSDPSPYEFPIFR